MNQNPPPAFCPNCGNRLEPGTAFCSNCGQPVSPPQQPAPPIQPAGQPPKPAGHSKMPLIIGLSAALVIVIALIIYAVTALIPGKDAKPTTTTPQQTTTLSTTATQQTQASTTAEETEPAPTTTATADPGTGNAQSIIQPLGVALDDLGNSMNGQFYYDAELYVYFSDYDASNLANIFRYDVENDIIESIFSGFGWSFVVYDNWLYFAGNEGDIIDNTYLLYRCRPDGSSLQLLQDGYHYGITVYDEMLYYIRYDDSSQLYKLCRASLDGSGEQIVIDDATGNYTIFQDRLYYVNQDAMLCRANPDGSGEQVIIDDATYFIIGQGRLIYLDWADNMFHAALDGSQETLILPAQDYPVYSLNSYGDLIYYTLSLDEMDEAESAYAYELYQTDFDGLTNTMIYSSYSYGNFLNIANDRVFVINYVMDPETGDMPAMLISMYLDGTDVMFISR